MSEKIKEEIKRLIMEDNPGYLPDEAEWEADRVMYRKNLHEQAKFNILKTL